MIALLQQRLASYRCTDARGEEQALKEILQELVLYGLWRADFFSIAAFQGGTSLRILHDLPRFSEDLDFILKVPDPDFAWPTYFGALGEVLAEFGVEAELLDRSRADRTVRQAMLKNNSIGHQLNLGFVDARDGRKLKVKLEIDSNPPPGSDFDYRYLDFPLDFEICCQDLPSNFALKIHALLCRPYVKGRDWFDLAWYVRQSVRPNLPLLSAALQQYGPWQGQGVEVDAAWLEIALKEVIDRIDWPQAAADVEPFLSQPEQRSLSLWNARFFHDKVERLCRAGE